MSQFRSITNREILNKLLHELTPETTPLWGILTPQHMVEHLVTAVEYTNGRKVIACSQTPEEANKSKQWLVYSDAEIPKSAISPILATLPKAHRFENIKTAIQELNKELDAFHEFFKKDDALSVHPTMGPMNYQEWLTFHVKHFTHHLKQFKLIE